MADYQKYFASEYTREEFDEALARRMSNIKEYTEIKQMEYNAITHHNDPAYASNKKHFKAEEDPLPDYLGKYFSRIIRITRLREVRVGLDVLLRPPAGRAILHVLSEFSGVFAFDIDHKPHDRGNADANAEINRMKAWRSVLKCSCQSVHDMQSFC